MDERVKDLISRLDDSEKPYLLTARESPKDPFRDLEYRNTIGVETASTVFSLGVQQLHQVSNFVS